MPAASEIKLIAHPPERGPRRPAALYCGCSCCCCCCLHSVGGVVGAVMAARRGGDVLPGPDMLSDPSPTAPVGVAQGTMKLSDVGLYYWVTVGGLIGLTMLAGATGLIVSLCVLPAVQLCAALLVAVGLLFGSAETRPAALRHLGKLTLGTLAGSAAGIGAMLILGIMFGVVK